ncbi:MAG: hypothetical protein AAGG38_02220 [Planctomycetota bacterium]
MIFLYPIATSGQVIAHYDGRGISLNDFGFDENETVEVNASRFWSYVHGIHYEAYVENLGIEIPHRVLDRRASEIFDARIKELGGSEAARESFKWVSSLNTALLESLHIWQNDPSKGDVYAEEHLYPLGISPDYWAWVKSKSLSDETFISQIEEAADYNEKDIERESRFVATQVLTHERLVVAWTERQEITPSDSAYDKFFKVLSNHQLHSLSFQAADFWRVNIFSDDKKANLNFYDLNLPTSVASVSVGPWPDLSQEAIDIVAQYVAASYLVPTEPHREQRNVVSVVTESKAKTELKWFVKLPSTNRNQSKNFGEQTDELRTRFDFAYSSQLFSREFLRELNNKIRLDAEFTWLAEQ